MSYLGDVNREINTVNICIILQYLVVHVYGYYSKESGII